jgi:hypothetical protein
LNFFNLHNDTSPKERNYLLDSNVWLPILGLDEESLSEHYQIFFSKIFKTDGASIVLCSLQLSEILNKLLRFHGHKVYASKYSPKDQNKPAFADFYKKHYKGSDDFKQQYINIIDDLQGYASHISFKDPLIKDLDQVVSFNANKLDFNDHYLYLLAKETGAIIITHDQDFFGLDVEVGTYNRKLYQEFKDNVKIKK